MAGLEGRSVGLLTARLALAAIFWVNGIANIQETHVTAEHLVSMGYPVPEVMAWVAALAELGGAFSLTLGFLTPIGCLALILFLIPASYSFHLPGALAGDPRQLTQILKNLAILGGLIALGFTGPGRYSVDAHARKRGPA